jgi:type I restriction enzyme S subunit
MAMNQSCYALVPKDSETFVHCFFLAKNLVEHLRVKASGSVFNSIISADIESTKLAIPKPDFVQKYSQLANPMFRKIECLSRENVELANLRDWLLPMLMNSQVTIGD